MVIDMSPEQERKLRLAESAAASAVLNGCDPDEVLARCQAGIADGIRLNQSSVRNVGTLAARATSALDAFARAVDAA